MYMSCSCSGGCVRWMASMRRMLVEDPWILLSTISITTNIIVLSRSTGPGLQARRNFIVCGAWICVVVVTPPIWSFQRLSPIFTSESKTVRTGFCNKFFPVELPARGGFCPSESCLLTGRLRVSAGVAVRSFGRRSQFLHFTWKRVLWSTLWDILSQRKFSLYVFSQPGFASSGAACS